MGGSIVMLANKLWLLAGNEYALPRIRFLSARFQSARLVCRLLALVVEIVQRSKHNRNQSD